VKAVDTRPATEGDLETLKELWLAFDREHPSPDYEDVDEAVELTEVEEYVREHVALLAENGDVVAGFILARMRGARHGWISDLYVSPDHRRGGAAGRLVREAATALRERGAEVIELDVRPWNEEARTVYERWGFRESKLTLATKAEDLEERLSKDAPAPSHGLVFAQTDDETRVTKAVRAYVPRLGRSARTDVHPPVNGWIAVDDELSSSDPALLRRLAQELSYRTGGVVLTLGVEEEAVVRYVLFDRGSVADEYCSLPEYHGPLPPGDVVALNANPTVAHRLAGADPNRVRAVAKTAASAADLPPPDDLYTELADVLGVPLP
jgi:ribosomal protein S18 acetylase RimI-like enzyme